MCTTELPTIRDCLRYGILLKETHPDFKSPTLSSKFMLQKVVEQVMQRWQRASFKLKPPVTAQDKTILDRLVGLWEKASKIAWKRVTSAKDVTKFEEQLDRLFDITKCRCPLLECGAEEVICTGCHCEEPECTGCPKNATDLPPCHVVCKCPAQQRIPLLELSFIKAQRKKVGEKSAAMIVNVDLKESKKQSEEAEKKQEKKEGQEAKDKRQAEKKKREEQEEIDYVETVADFMREDPNDNCENQIDKENNSDWKVSNTRDRIRTRNRRSIKNVAMASIRFGLSANATAAVANATLLDHGVISQDNITEVIDAKKVQRAKDSLHKELQEKAAIKYQEDKIECILFDGRKDWTLMYQEVEGSSQVYPTIQKEEHYSVVAEPGGQYLFHFTPDEADKTHTAAEQIARALVEWMKKYGVDKTLQFIGGDSTNVNSGIWGGVFQFVEKMLGRPLNWIVCGLHLNELPLRHLVSDLDGPTKSDTGFSGPLGKALATVTELPVKKTFKAVTIGSDLIELDDEIVKDLSSDQKYGYEMVKAIRTGKLSPKLANLEIGPVCHSRWLTTANRFLRMWVSQHGFKGKEAKNLKLIVEYIVGVYYPTWFSYKVKNHWLQGAPICLEQLHLTLQQDKQVINIVFPYLESSAWWAHPEMLLQTLLCSNSADDRKFAVEKILQLRQRTVNSENIRTHHKVKLNRKASCLKELIIWEEDKITEPILTLKLSEDQIKNFETAPMSVPEIPVHGQSMERCVKEVTAASEAVYGYERRDGFIRARLVNRELTGGVIRSKQDHARIVGVGSV